LEHVKFIDSIIGESARVLKKNGVHLAMFPYATCIIEPHLHIPFAHWIPPGGFRAKYLAFFHFLKGKGRQARQLGRSNDDYLQHHTYYRFKNEFMMLAETYFEHYVSDRKALAASKLQLMQEKSLWARGLAVLFRPLFAGNWLSTLRSEAALFINPKK
jgi:hypothetical protein